VAEEVESREAIIGRLRKEYLRAGVSFTAAELEADAEMELLRRRCFDQRRDLHPEFVSAEDPVERWATMEVPADEQATARLVAVMQEKKATAIDISSLG